MKRLGESHAQAANEATEADRGDHGERGDRERPGNDSMDPKELRIPSPNPLLPGWGEMSHDWAMLSNVKHSYAVMQCCA